MLVLCSRNARPLKGLVRRPHVDQHGCPSKRAKRASLEGVSIKDGGRSLCAGVTKPGRRVNTIQRRTAKKPLGLRSQSWRDTEIVLLASHGNWHLIRNHIIHS
jgi:hypothetical protein